jgi:hypothetical protein
MNPIENAAPSNVTDRGNEFVEVTPGRFAQSNPQPIVFTAEFKRSVDQLSRDVVLAMRQKGDK